MDPYSSASSSSTSLSSRISSQSSFALQETSKSTPEKPLQILKVLLDILHRNGIPGPNLIRLEREFNLVAGEGGEGTVFRASTQFQQNLASIPVKSSNPRLIQSSKVWRNCVIKRLRSDEGRGLAFQVNSAHTEIKLLSKSSLRSHPNVIKLLGWALCLDSLENPASRIPQLPLLILEKAEFDLRSFLSGPEYKRTTYMDLCHICLGVGRGLEALHVEDLSHGDIKPANVLILDQWVSAPDSQAVSCRWLPKLCDFGLATGLKEDDGPNIKRYHGTGGWKPPECYLDSPPASLQLCDVFAYGLVSWCIFIGDPSSPISTKLNQDEESATIKDQLGEQIFYQKASHSIRTLYGLMENDISLTLAELTNRVVNLGSGAGKKESSLRRRRKAFLEGPRDVRVEQINRVLILLRDSLNDDPHSRHRRPWEYMDFGLHESIPLVQDPIKRSSQSESSITRKSTQRLFSSCNNVLALISHTKRLILQRLAHSYRQAMKRTTRTLMTFIFAHLPSLVAQDPLEQVYDEMFFEVELSLRNKEARSEDRKRFKIYTFEPIDSSTLDHEEGDRCHSLDRLYYYLYQAIADAASDANIRFNNISSLSSSEIDSIRAVFGRPQSSIYSLTVHSFARMRSRVKICCWQEYCRNQDPPYTYDGPAVSVLLPEAQAILEETSMLVMLSDFDFDVLTWLWRGQIATAVFNALGHESEKLWNWLSKDYLGPKEKTERMALFLERGCNIGQELHSDGSSRSVFQIYLESLPLGELAVTVCRQFKRHAARDGATPWEQFYLTGQSPDWHDDEPMSEKDLVRTALHDAVRASNYSVVEYLVRTNFVVGVKDASGRTALALAEEFGHNIAKVEVKKRHVQNNQIIALLRQTKSPTNRPLRHGLQPASQTLPVGWEATELGADLTVYQETSIEWEADPLTFFTPREGLIENKLALGQRRVTGQGQAYYLDTLRFLHTKFKGSERAESATEPRYGEDWYEKKVRESTARPLVPHSDRSLRYTVMNIAYYVLEYIMAGLATLIGFGTSNIYVVALLLLVALYLYDTWI